MTRKFTFLILIFSLLCHQALADGAATPESTRDASREVPEPFQIRTPADTALDWDGRGRVLVPKGSEQMVKATLTQHAHIQLPQGITALPTPDTNDPRTFTFPAKCIVSTAPVNRWQLAMVIGQSVAAICLWGTLVGSMLPLAFRRFGIDPGYASSPFVATFVDVTGIVIYFSIAQVWLGL